MTMVWWVKVDSYAGWNFSESCPHCPVILSVGKALSKLFMRAGDGEQGEDTIRREKGKRIGFKSWGGPPHTLCARDGQ